MEEITTIITRELTIIKIKYNHISLITLIPLYQNEITLQITLQTESIPRHEI